MFKGKSLICASHLQCEFLRAQEWNIVIPIDQLACESCSLHTQLTRQHSFQPLPPLSGDDPTILWVPPLPLALVQIVFYSLFISLNKTGGEGKWLESLSLTSPHLRGHLWMWGGDDYASISAHFKWCTTHVPSVKDKGWVVVVGGGVS